jgi:PKD repeat protein
VKTISPALIVFLCLLQHHVNAQGGMWTWIHGDTITNSAGTPGTMGVPDPSNKAPAVYEPVYWVGENGTLWIYGGFNAVGDLYQTLWKYDIYSNTWTWMQGSLSPNQYANYGVQGIPSPTNTPGSRNCSVSWIDTSGNFWLMGGYTVSNSTLGDLWKLDTTTLEWTWMNGSSIIGTTNSLSLGISSSVNTPAAVTETNCGWTDNQNQLWYFGGISTYYLGFYDEVIKYNISTNEWTWVRGTGYNSQPAYGVKGVPAATNNPGARIVYSHWTDDNGNFWMMNGATVWAWAEDRNDVWRYNPVTNEWTWMAGTSIADDAGNYFSMCDLNSTNNPGGRSEDKSTFRDHNNKVWSFAGTTSANNDNFNDLWIFDPDSLNYKWMHGSNLFNQPGVYGQLNIASPANIPHSRDGAIMFGDTLCHIYIFGGISRKPFTATYNDVWKFTPDTNCIPCNVANPLAAFTAPNQICPGTCTNFMNTSSNATSFVWIFPGGNPAVSTDVSPANICYNTPGAYDVTLVATGQNGSDTIYLQNYIHVFPAPPAQGILQMGDTLFANPGSTLYQWYFNGTLISGATNYFYVAAQSGNYSVIATDENGCEVEAVINNVIASSSQLAPDSYQDGSWQLVINPNPVIDILEIKNLKTTEKISFTIYNTLGSAVKLPIANCKLPTCSLDVSDLPPGCYILEITSDKKINRTKFLKQ